MKIRWKIDLAISGAFLVGLGLAGVGAYTILTKNALEESLQNARIMIEGASAIRTWRTPIAASSPSPSCSRC